MKSCQEITRLVSESLDRRLTLREWIGVRLHLMMCKLCHGFSVDLGRIRDAAREHADPDPTVRLSAEAKARIKRAMA